MNGAALIAESWPAKARAKAAGIMQASGGIGFFLATALYLFIGPYGWRWVFALGVLPAIVAFYIRWSLEEPERCSEVESHLGEAPTGTAGEKELVQIHPLGRQTLVRNSGRLVEGAETHGEVMGAVA